MSYIRSIACGMIDVDLLEPDARKDVMVALTRELKARGVHISLWPLSNLPRTKRNNKRHRLAKADVTYTFRGRGWAHTAPLCYGCQKVLHLLEPQHNTQGGNDDQTDQP